MQKIFEVTLKNIYRGGGGRGLEWKMVRAGARGLGQGAPLGVPRGVAQRVRHRAVQVRAVSIMTIMAVMAVMAVMAIMAVLGPKFESICSSCPWEFLNKIDILQGASGVLNPSPQKFSHTPKII